jgi:hypothetical protein
VNGGGDVVNDTKGDTMMYTMPKVDLSVLTDEERELAEGIVATRGKNAGRLRASKPPVERKRVYVDVESPGPMYKRLKIEGGETAYIWRMVAFYVSPISQHHCMPVMADCDLPADDFDKRMKLAKELDKIVDKIVDTVPKDQWYGVARWHGLV